MQTPLPRRRRDSRDATASIFDIGGEDFERRRRDENYSSPRPSNEYRMALESLLKAKQRESSSRRAATRPKTTAVVSSSRRHFPPLLPRNPSLSKVKPAVVLVTTADDGTAAATTTTPATETNRHGRWGAKPNYDYEAKMPSLRTSQMLGKHWSATKKPTSHEQSTRRNVDVRLAPVNSARNFVDFRLLLPTPAGGALSSGETRTADVFSSGLGWNVEAPDMSWEEFHGWNPDCSKDVFLRCLSWLRDCYMQLPELQPSRCSLTTFAKVRTDSDEVI